MKRIIAIYLAGFIDGDGSIHVRLKPNKTYRYKFQIAVNVVLYQSTKERKFLERLLREIKLGYLRDRNDGITEYIFGKESEIEKILKLVLPYLRLKKRQAILMLKILKLKSKIFSAREFVKLAKLIDQFQDLNYSKKRVNNSEVVRKVLEQY